uniref:SET domain-containing protein n=1 Tax=Odontella aurita TaxID=265563 RepID=A0A7S4JSW4_9STRA|mmetsp:Transcript_53446/g.159942  ORF Transcript_53446/g.159942 Transcript_53446/m.159942 type:complete len:486 (+) Transcript_53446:147-1604(+)
MRIAVAAVAAAVALSASSSSLRVSGFAPLSRGSARGSRPLSRGPVFENVGARRSPTRPAAPGSGTVTGTGTVLSALNIQENAPRDVGSMDQWATNYGVQKADGFQLTSEDGVDFGVMTTQPLADGSPVLQVPSNMILSSGGCRDELIQMGGNVAEAADMLARYGAGDQIQQFYLFLKVLVEYQKGDNSPWFPWLNAMPRLFYNAVSMTDFCYECLPPLVFALSRKERVKFDNYFDALQKVDFLDPMIKGDKDLAKWAFNIVLTRALGPDGGDKFIVPLADMFNHGTETEVAIGFDEEGNCNAYTTKNVQEGSPLRMSYGDPSNPSYFFAKYGFLDETSPATFCKIMLNGNDERLKNLGYDFSRMLFFKETGEISEEVWDVMLYQVLASNLEYQNAFYDAHLNGDADTKRAYHEHYFSQTSMALKEHVDNFLKQLDELSAKSIGKNLEDHPRLPLILRHNEFVKQTFLAVSQRLNAMVAERDPVGA